MFNKFNILNALKIHSDILIELRDGEAILCTADFRNKYIRKKRKPKFMFRDRTILIFSWTDNQYKVIDPSKIRTWQPLSKILRNER